MRSHPLGTTETRRHKQPGKQRLSYRVQSPKMTLIQKLNLKPGAVAVINSPKSILVEFKSFKPAPAIPSGAKEYFDFVLLFATNAKELEPAWKRIIPALKDDAVFWVA